MNVGDDFNKPFFNNMIALDARGKRTRKDNLYMFLLLSKENSPVSILRTPPRNRFVLSKAETVTKGTQEESDTDTIFPLTCAKQVKGNKNNINTTQMYFIS